jgi:GTP-binding protein LepA
VEAQTVANCYTAVEQGVTVVPVLNKIDLPSADPERVIDEIEDIIGIDATDAVRASAKNGVGIDDILEAVIAKIPPPEGTRCAVAGLDHRFVVRQLRRRGHAGARDARRAAPARQAAADGRRLHPQLRAGRRLHAEIGRARRAVGGRCGFIIAGIKELKAAKVGDTVTLANRRADAALPGFKEVKPQVFAGLYPVESNQYEALRDALDKLKLNDASLHFEPEVSQALASASAAASWACCTWTSCRSGSSANTTWT